MIELAGSSCVGATLRAKVSVPPLFGVPAAAAVLDAWLAVEVLELLALLGVLELLEPQAASSGPSEANADAFAPFASSLRRVNTKRSSSKRDSLQRSWSDNVDQLT
jgi:hypothetical protein